MYMPIRFGNGNPDNEHRSLYDGIEAGRSWWDSFARRPGLLEFRSRMQAHTYWVTGLLADPEQAEVSGAFSYPYTSSGEPSQDGRAPNEIFVQWNFTRTRAAPR